MIEPSLLAALDHAAGPGGVLTGADTASYARDWRGLYQGNAAAVLRPADTAALAACVRLCAQAGVAMVPQGGNTGLVGGATPSALGTQVVISLSRMNRLRDVDPAGLTMLVEAGVTLKAAQDAALDAHCLLPLSISAEGSAMIGGVLATNAGGNNTLRFGNARDLVLGLEVVLPDGRVWNGLRRLRKDNTGYCLRQLFVGSEGTLGIIAAAVLRLAPLPAASAAALCAMDRIQGALDLLARFQRRDAAALHAFEYMSGQSVALVLRHIPGVVLPLPEARHYALIEIAGPDSASLRTTLESVLGSALEDGTIQDAVLAESEAQRLSLWRLREEHAEAQKRAGASVKNDISVPIAAVPDLLDSAESAVRAVMPGIRAAPFGHLGDGNIHFNLVQPEDTSADAFMACADRLMDAVNQVVRGLDGSFSAEHGIGQLKPAMLADWRGGVELDLMRRLKQAIDPAGLMNPGKLLC